MREMGEMREMREMRETKRRIHAQCPKKCF
jgi:hypothetical protein